MEIIVERGLKWEIRQSEFGFRMSLLESAQVDFLCILWAWSGHVLSFISKEEVKDTAVFWPKGVRSHCSLLLASQAWSQTLTCPGVGAPAPLLASPPFLEASMLLFLFPFKITVPDVLHGSSRMRNKATLDDLGWTDFCDSIKNSWGTRGMYCRWIRLSPFPSHFR